MKGTWKVEFARVLGATVRIMYAAGRQDLDSAHGEQRSAETGGNTIIY